MVGVSACWRGCGMWHCGARGSGVVGSVGCLLRARCDPPRCHFLARISVGSFRLQRPGRRRRARPRRRPRPPWLFRPQRARSRSRWSLGPFNHVAVTDVSSCISVFSVAAFDLDSECQCRLHYVGHVVVACVRDWVLGLGLGDSPPPPHRHLLRCVAQARKGSRSSYWRVPQVLSPSSCGVLFVWWAL